MARSVFLHPLLAISAAAVILLSMALASSAGELDWASVSAAVVRIPGRCNGSVGECGGEEEELGMESEVSRRILATSRYVSYGALQRNTVPCSRRGASYYNCRTGAQANPYRRGCTTITRCRS